MPDSVEELWPTLHTDALHGLAGVLTLAIAPYTEADPVAVLLNILTAFGNVVGSHAHFLVERTKHPLRLFAALVGLTGRPSALTSTSRCPPTPSSSSS